jgi:hypothetical protein
MIDAVKENIQPLPQFDIFKDPPASIAGDQQVCLMNIIELKVFYGVIVFSIGAIISDRTRFFQFGI